MHESAQRNIHNGRASIEDAILEYFQSQVAAAWKKSAFSGPTVGIEQEFFIFNQKTSKPSTLSESQNFLTALSKISEWKIFNERKPNSGNYITRVSYEHGPTRYSSLKYEYPPHMMELAVTYFPDLHSLSREIEDRWNEIVTAADRVGLRVHLSPFIKPPVLDRSEQAEIDPKMIALSDSRRRYFKERGEPVDESIVDFPSFMAATQAQVRIPHLFGNPQFMHRLYALEIACLPLLNKSPSSIAKRNSIYDSVFKGLRLLGVPDLKEWSVLNWVSALCDTHVVSPGSSSVTVRDLWNSGEINDVSVLMQKTRDLQIIRPKITGAVEFRADSSRSSPQELIEVAAIRFGACLIAADSKQPIPFEEKSFEELRSIWKRTLSQSTWSDENLSIARDTFEHMLYSLSNRGLNEEKLLKDPSF